MIILDFGSGNTCQNNPHIIRKMLEGLEALSPDFKRQIVIKWQLFKESGENIRLVNYAFKLAYGYAEKMGFCTTASVFDRASLLHLLEVSNFDLPFVKIANYPDLWELGLLVPRKIPVLQSLGFFNQEDYFSLKGQKPCNPVSFLHCVTEYPTTMEQYRKDFTTLELESGISDHTTNWDLYKRFRPVNYECHYKLPDSTGLDAGPFARTPQDLLELDQYLQQEEK